MQNQEKPCRHEYVKIFQRKYKGLGRRLVSTRGYLPVGFTIKDFSHLSGGSFCFCVGCRARLFPSRIESAKLAKTGLAKPNEVELSSLAITLPETSQIEDVWVEENASEASGDSDAALPVVNVEELQIESIEVSDIADKKVIVSGEDDLEEEEGEE